MKFLLLLTLCGFISCSSPTPNLRETKKEIPITTRIADLGLEPRDLRIDIEKSAYLLHLVHELDTLMSYPICLGPNPVDPKLIQGDGCTPEGTFNIRDLYPHSKWSKFIWIDYPNKTSWARFNQAIAEGKIPKDAKIGGEIGIHGTPKGREDLISNQVNWTLGCISVTEKAIDEIYAVIDKTTQIHIYH
ncbi:MAG: murein L,D-transpeptidase family protein [Flavobacteriales bacterium]